MRYINIILIVLFLAGCSGSLQNLSDAKWAVKNYYESGEYDADLQNVIEEIKSRFENVDISDKMTVVFDVDETTLSNYEYIKSIDFGYKYDLWNEYLLKGEAEPIKPVLELYKWFQAKGANIVFITGRVMETYEATRRNLASAGYNNYDTLICRTPENKNWPAEIYKTAERQMLTGKGYNIIATIGDLHSDLNGGYTGQKFKLPNYLYSF